MTSQRAAVQPQRDRPGPNDDVGRNDFGIEGKIHGTDTHKADGVVSGDVR